MTLIRSSEFKNKSTRYKGGFFHSSLSGFQEENETVRLPFARDVSVGDKVKIFR